VTAKRVVRRAVAAADVRRAVIHYTSEAGLDVAGRFIASVETAVRVISQRPATGSPRYGELLGLPGLRTRAVGRFPWLIFYREDAMSVEIWRVLHKRSDIPAFIDPADPGESGESGEPHED
jgi:toxin ParE1/3/4